MVRPKNVWLGHVKNLNNIILKNILKKKNKQKKQERNSWSFEIQSASMKMVEK